MRTLIILSIINKEGETDFALSKCWANRLTKFIDKVWNRALNKVGIDNVDTFTVVEIKCIVRLKKADISASEVFYCDDFRGAVENRNCEFYTEKEKERGLSKLNEILSANGFRRCKNERLKRLL